MCWSGRMTVGLVAMAATVAAVAGPTAPAAGPALAPRTHGFMLYLSQPLGGGAGVGGMRPKFGLRLEQVRMLGNSGAPDAGDPLQRRELVGWQMEGLGHFSASGMKIELGNRVTYDVSHGAFGPQRWLSNSGPRQTSTMSRMGGAPPRAADLLDERAASLRNFDPHFASERGASFHDSFKDSVESTAMMHDVAAAAVSTLKLSRSGVVQRAGQLGPRPFSMPLRGETR